MFKITGSITRESLEIISALKDLGEIDVQLIDSPTETKEKIIQKKSHKDARVVHLVRSMVSHCSDSLPCEHCPGEILCDKISAVDYPLEIKKITDITEDDIDFIARDINFEDVGIIGR